MTAYLLIVISQLFLITSCEKETEEPLNLSSKIEKKVLGIAKDKNIPSLELTITTEQDVISFNYNHKEVEKQSIYGIGSTTKFLSSILIFKLIEDEKLKIDDKVIDYVDLTQPITGIENVTVKNLLNHTSGLSDYTKNSGWITSVMNNNAPKTFEEKILLINGATENSDSFSYSNTNYLFLEKIVETIVGESYEVAFNNFYSANNLSDIKMGIDENGLQAFFGQTEQASPDVSDWREYFGFDGGAYTDTKTLDEFLTKLFRDKSILKSSTISEMENWIAMEPMTIPIGNGIISEYGNGIMKLTYDEQEYIGHFGSTLKYQSMAFYNTKKNISISITTNCSGRYFNNVFFQEIIPAILDEL
ncbi:serine hydrolase domain-containing protein [Aquimarina aquimarini]|uniref:serine hydrolase domain-containing protein n=1 Tax=Aquimarina aquimarini TaxID=1191734 RepID=UPI000D54D78E|nr:serine hydrolase domain-containing protein [Aquimarina aquimarini]